MTGDIQIKQAAVVLLNYPLDYQISTQIARNNLEYVRAYTTKVLIKPLICSSVCPPHFSPWSPNDLVDPFNLPITATTCGVCVVYLSSLQHGAIHPCSILPVL